MGYRYLTDTVAIDSNILKYYFKEKEVLSWLSLMSHVPTKETHKYIKCISGCCQVKITGCSGKQ